MLGPREAQPVPGQERQQHTADPRIDAQEVRLGVGSRREGGRPRQGEQQADELGQAGAAKAGDGLEEADRREQHDPGRQIGRDQDQEGDRHGEADRDLRGNPRHQPE
jgi:hypothetical protein